MKLNKKSLIIFIVINSLPFIILSIYYLFFVAFNCNLSFENILGIVATYYGALILATLMLLPFIILYYSLVILIFSIVSFIRSKKYKPQKIEFLGRFYLSISHSAILFIVSLLICINYEKIYNSTYNWTFLFIGYIIFIILTFLTYILNLVIDSINRSFF